MPTYEYTCTACGHQLDAVQKFSDEPLSVCPECGGALRKVYGAVGIVLKGSGFYKTDSRTSAGKAAAAKESNGSNGKDTSKSDTSSDSGSRSESASTSSTSSASSSSDKKESKAPVSTGS